MLVPYTAYRETHIRHHAYLNKPNDWELWPYSDPQAPRWFRKIFVWCDLLLGFATAPIVYGRIYFHKDSPLKPEQRRAIRWEYFGMACFWAAILGVVAYYNRLGVRSCSCGSFPIRWLDSSRMAASSPSTSA